MKKNKNITIEINSIYYILIAYLPLSFLSDAANKILNTYKYDFSRISIILRIFFEFIFLLLIFFFFNKQRQTFVQLLVISLFLFLFGVFILNIINNFNEYEYLENIVTFNKYFFLFITYFATYTISYSKQKFNNIIFIIESIFIINTVFSIIGIFTSFPFLLTYVDADYRFGYMGFIPAQNEATLFYLLAVSYFYYKYINNVSKKNLITLGIILIGASILGTKGIYIFLAMLLIYHLIFNANLAQRFFFGIVCIFGVIKTVQFAQSDNGLVFFDFFVNQIENNGVISMLLTGRESFIELKLYKLLFTQWSPLNYIFGGQDQTKYLMEMDILDLFLFMGIFGSFIYFILLRISIFSFKLNSFSIFFIISYLLVATFGGHFFTSAVNAGYLVFVTLYIKKYVN